MNSVPGNTVSSGYPHSSSADSTVLEISCRSHRLVLDKEGTLTESENSASGHLMASISSCPRRLIDAHTFKCVVFDEDTIIPPYAILSHRWTGEENELLYNEFLHPQNTTCDKLGYQKIAGTCRQALQDGIRYIWVDTACIKKGDPVDVSANIKSMYGFYQNAEICYVYLFDYEGELNPRFYHNQWFMRGWTLEELFAPRTVVFFNKAWQRLGDKYGLRENLHKRTLIPKALLSGERSIQEVDFLVRISWSVKRRTTKPNDGAYCLQGLLGINTVEPDYNESSEAAYNRLGKELVRKYPELKQRFADVFSCDPDDESLFWSTIYAKSEEHWEIMFNAPWNQKILENYPPESVWRV
ncbi:hypothetical protein VKT23_006646 [Stygiomarasmius scandens]|uniref:Heterokaryon incompatibility domain-containing protein n=1 Tax=Marasmiellus scandens TaxID=2682957 RepID=A0ABR1JQY5_9AGAR